ncbi:uncharacterized protein [Euphorbia lathyris]|uniref:uncharacterized protein n=1 Tax=Euphorbia lathyris TaxID=212925 RepID=UPI0033130DE2
MGNSRQNSKKSSFSSAFNFFKRRPRRVDQDNYDDISSIRRAFSSDEDGRGPWRVADPRVDTKTSDFIANFYATRVTEPDHIYQPAANA